MFGMSAKRKANTELTHENWDKEDPIENEEAEIGTFQTASKEVMEKRVIRTAKRRNSSHDEAKKSVFSGFGFKKTQPASYDFLANLTNGKGSDQFKMKGDNLTTSLFTNKSAATIPPANAFMMPITSSSTKSTFVTTTTQSSIFGSVATSTSLSPFAIKVDPKDNKTNSLKSSNVITSPTSTNLFATSPTSANSKSFSSSVNSPTTIENKLKENRTSTSDTKNTKNEDNQPDTKGNNDKKIKYYAKLQGLNESVLDWIKKHVEETPLCILSPIFKDYDRHLKEIQDEYHGPDKEETKDNTNAAKGNDPIGKKVIESTNSKLDSSVLTKKDTTNAKNTSIFSLQSKSQANTSAFVSNNTTSSPAFPFSTNTPATSNTTSPISSPGFSFGSKTNITKTSLTSSPGFTFGSKIATPATKNSTSLFSLNANSPVSSTNGTSLFSLNVNSPMTSTGGNAPFSFGTGKPFSLNNVQKPAETPNEGNEENDEPPKVEFTPVVEENSVYDKRCKVFIKKENNEYVDKGVGTLYVKKIEESGKHQLLVRANTNLGNVMLNLILSSSIPMQRMGKNNVMLVCIPNPDYKPPPIPVLIRVKTSEEADELLETLNKFKK